MAILNVGPNSTYATITAAMSQAAASDSVVLESGYRNETATVTQSGMTVTGGANSTGIALQLGPGITALTLGGLAPINVRDGSGGNAIVGNDGNNLITVTGGADSVSGGAGNDRLVVDYRLTSGAVTGNSTSNFADAGGLGTVTVNGGFEHFTVMTGSGADTITTGAGDDYITTGAGASTVTAGQGANTIIGGSGADTVTALDGGNWINAGNGANNITSGLGNDVIISGTGTDTITAGGGADRIFVGGGADTVSSGAGNDRLTIDYSAFTTAVTGGVTGGNLGSGYTGHVADLAGNQVDFVGTENIHITTGTGNDSITTGGGDDLLKTGAGNDSLNSAGGNDVLDGGAGNDFLNAGSGNDSLSAGSGNDSLDGGTGADIMSGGEGGDTLRGGEGNDRMFGGNGNDILFGDAGNDVIIGGLGQDKMQGGAARDYFVFQSSADSGTTATTRDQISRFEDGIDKIDLRGIDAHPGGGNNMFDFVKGGFSGDGGEVRVHAWGANTMVAVDLDGDRRPDFQIVLAGTHTLNAGDFLL